MRVPREGLPSLVCDFKHSRLRQVSDRKNVCVNLDVADAIEGFDVMCTGRDCSAMLPHVCCL